MQSSIAAAQVPTITDMYTALSCPKNLPVNARMISAIAGGYISISMGIEYSIIALRPIFETAKENTVNKIAQTLYGTLPFVILTKVSEQEVTSPIEVLRQAKVIVTARIIFPALIIQKVRATAYP